MVSNTSKKFGTSGIGYVRKRTSRTRGNLLLVPATEVVFHIAASSNKKASRKTCLIPQIIENTPPARPQEPLISRPSEPVLRPNQTVSFNIEETEIEEQTDYEYRKIKEVESWQALRSVMLLTSIEQHAIYTETCIHCPVREVEDPGIAEYRCQDCIQTLLCRDCIVSLHALTCLHVVEKWVPGLGTFCETVLPELQILRVPEQVPPNINTRKTMTLIDDKGRTHYDCIIIYGNRSAHSLASSLLRLGFWPVSASTPNVAVSIRLLSLLDCLTLECHTSCKGFTAAVDKLNYKRGLQVQSKLSSVGRGECLPEFRLFWNALKNAPLSLNEDLKSWIITCPACPKTPEEGGIIVAMDANFGLVHKRNSGKTHTMSSPLDGRFFLPQNTVDEFVEGYYQDQKDNDEQCSQFQAGDALRSKNKTPNLTVTGVFGCSCRHEIPLVFMDIRHGERLAYSVLSLQHLKQRDMHIRAMYDIACVLNSHLKKRNSSELLQNILLAISQFHCYGHKGLCQVTMSPRRMAGFGLSDGEQMERLWSYLRLFAKITKEQTPGHRKELLILALENFADRKMHNIGVTLCQKLTKARDGKSTAEKNLEEELDSILAPADSAGFIQQLKDEEEMQFQATTSTVSSSSSPNWRRAYAKELLRFYTLQSQLTSGIIYADDTEKVLQATKQIQTSSKKLEIYEKRHKLQRWTETSSDYQRELKCIDDTRRKGLLLKLQGLAHEKQFFIDLKKKYSEGQTVSDRLCKQLKRICTRISTTTKSYNMGAHSREEGIYPTSIRNDDVRVGSVLFDTLEQEGYTSTIPSQVRRKVIDQSNLVKRCEEEQVLVLSEMHNSYVHFGQLHCVVSEMIESLPRNTLFQVGLYSVGMQFLGQQQIHLRKMYSLFHTEIDIPLPPECPPELLLNVGSDKGTQGEADSRDQNADDQEGEEEQDKEEEEDEEEVEEEDEEDEDPLPSESVEIIYC